MAVGIRGSVGIFRLRAKATNFSFFFLIFRLKVIPTFIREDSGSNLSQGRAFPAEVLRSSVPSDKLWENILFRPFQLPSRFFLIDLRTIRSYKIELLTESQQDSTK
jgi:hypothetical protein